MTTKLYKHVNAPKNKVLALALLIAVSPTLAGCVTSAGNCTGWKPILLQPASDAYLQKNDKNASDGVTNHNLYGTDLKCWSKQLELRS